MKRHMTGAIIAGLAALAATPLIVAQAQAGTYVIRNCNVPGHATAPITPWRVLPATKTVAFNHCAEGGGFGFTFPGEHTMASGESIAFKLSPPTTIKLQRVKLWYIYRLAGTGSQVIGVTHEFDDHGVAYTMRETLAPGATYLATGQYDNFSQDKNYQFQVAVRCAGSGQSSPAPDCHPSSAVPLEIRGAEVTLEEGSAPLGSVTGGTLFADGTVSGVRGLDYSASDSGSGLRRIEALVDDSVLATKDLGGSCPYINFIACPTVDRGTLSIDTRRVADGVHPVILRMTDAAGNQERVQPQLIHVRNARSASAPAASALKGAPAANLTVRFAHTKRSSRVIAFGRKVTIRGRLSDAEKSGIGGARIDVMQRTRVAGSHERRVGRIKTRSNGRFSYRRSMRGATRTLRLEYLPPGAGSATKSRKLRVRVRSAARLHVSLRGRIVRFRGRIVSRPLPRHGKRVRLQGKAPGYAWSTFARKRTDRHGRFAGRYRLPVRRPGVRIAIRAFVPSERGYSYLSYRGRAKRLRVR